MADEIVGKTIDELDPITPTEDTHLVGRNGEVGGATGRFKLKDSPTLANIISKQTRLARALAADPDAGDGSLLLDYNAQGFGSGDDYGINLAESFAERHTIARNTVKNVFGKRCELIQYAANTPAYEYDATTGKWRLSIEESRTNIATRNKADANALATWAKANVTVATVADPQFGNVIELTDDATNAAHRVTLDLATTDSVVRVRSVYVKAPASNAIPYAVISSRTSTDDNDFNLVINLSTGAYTSTGSGITPTSVKPLGGGWYRIGLHVAQTNVSTRAFTIGMSESALGTAASYAGTGKKLLIALPQWETGTLATSPIETESITVTRLADVVTAPDLSGWFNASGMTFVYKLSKADLGSAAAFLTIGKDNNYRCSLYVVSGNAIGLLVRNTLGIDFNATTNFSYNGGEVNIALSIHPTLPTLVSVDGGTPFNSGAAFEAITDADKLSYSNLLGGVNPDLGIKSTKAIKGYITGTQLQELSTP